MSLHISIPKEKETAEKRVAASPDTVKKLVSLGCKISIEENAGLESAFTNDEYKNAGANIIKSSEVSELYKKADVILCVQTPNAEGPAANIKKNALLIGLLDPHSNKNLTKTLKDLSLSAFSMELVPRITRAQSMDVLSSQSNLAGYKSVLDAAQYYPKAFPMMMTAAGTIPPAKVFIMGAGVAGLQAIATARRLGAVVSATDVRPAAKEQVESLGASFVAIEDEEFKEAETAGGYAKEMSKSYQKKQAALIEEHIEKQDIVITTALIPGRPAPTLITNAMVKSMKPGSVIVDLAVETGGNCEASKPGEVVELSGIKIIGHQNVPSRLARDASALYAKNLLTLVTNIISDDGKELTIDWEDEIIQSIALSKDGKIIHPLLSKDSKTSKASSASKAQTSAKTSKTEKKSATKKNGAK